MKRLLMVLVIAAMAAWAAPADAAAYLDFSLGASGLGTISYAGGANPLVGTSIPVVNVQGVGTALNANVYLTITNGVLTFTTGSYVGSPTTSEWDFGSLGTFTVTGDISALGLVGVPLVSGTIQNAKVLNIGGTFMTSGYAIQDSKNQALTDYYGFTAPGYEGGWNLGFYTTTAPSAPGAFTTGTNANVTSGDLVNYQVPEPGSMLLLGTGLFGLAGAVRRRLKK